MLVRRLASVLISTTLVAASVAVGAAVAPTAEAVTSTAVAAAAAQPYQVTFVARTCPTYADIMANRARNNIQESLRDLGKDTVYTAGQPISPTIETPNQPRCTPLLDWQFALGTGYTGKTPATDYLSTVTGDYGQSIRVLPTTPELDSNGVATGRSLAAAVTVTLTDEQAKRAQGSNSLWTQGGTKADPLLKSVFGNAYGFGALRCAVDNLNGDNVEWIGFPSGARHVFCYYYAVQPPPQAGTIIVRKSLETGTNGPALFRYVGNISYTVTNDFSLTPQSDTKPASATFIRAAGDAWDFEEQKTTGFTLVSLTCAQTTPPETGPASTWTITGAKAVVRVGDGATVVCNYVNREVPPPTGQLRLTKVTLGGVGSFPFKITDPDGDTTKALATTATAGLPVVVASADAAKSGTWTAREQLPEPTAGGRWSIASIQCNGEAKTPVLTEGPSGQNYVSVSGVISPSTAVACEFANVFTPSGRLFVEKRTSGGVGTFSFPVARADQFDELGNPRVLFSFLGVTTTSPGEVTEAAPLPGYRPLTLLPVGKGAASTYVIGELRPPASSAGSWNLTAVTCTDVDTDAVLSEVVDLAGDYVKVELTEEHAQVRCVFDNEFVAAGAVANDSAVLVSKTIQGTRAGQQGAVRLELTCADGTTGTFAIDAGTTGTVGQEAPFVVPVATECTVAESRTGETTAAQLDSTLVSVGTGDAVAALSTTFTTVPGTTTQVAFVDVYGGLAPSGATPATPGYALAGLLLVCLGAVAYAAAGQVD